MFYFIVDVVWLMVYKYRQVLLKKRFSGF